MADYPAVQAVNKTLTGSTVDQITFADSWPLVEVVNRGEGVIWVTASTRGEPDDPEVEGDDCQPVLPGERITVVNSRSAQGGAIIKVMGDGDAYSIVGAQRA